MEEVFSSRDQGDVVRTSNITEITITQGSRYEGHSVGELVDQELNALSF